MSKIFSFYEDKWFNFFKIIIINVKLVADRRVILCVVLCIWKQFPGTGCWEQRFLEDRSACIMSAAASPSTACVFACNKISYKNSASLISGMVSSCDVIRILIDFQKDDNIVKRKSNNMNL